MGKSLKEEAQELASIFIQEYKDNGLEAKNFDRSLDLNDDEMIASRRLAREHGKDYDEVYNLLKEELIKASYE